MLQWQQYGIAVFLERLCFRIMSVVGISLMPYSSPNVSLHVNYPPQVVHQFPHLNKSSYAALFD